MNGEFSSFQHLWKLSSDWKVISPIMVVLIDSAIDKAKGKGGLLRPPKSSGPPISPELVLSSACRINTF